MANLIITKEDIENWRRIHNELLNDWRFLDSIIKAATTMRSTMGAAADQKVIFEDASPAIVSHIKALEAFKPKQIDTKDTP